MSGNLTMFEEEQREVQAICDRLVRDAQALAVLLVDRNGQEIARAGQTQHLDVTSLSSLIAGNVAASGGIAKLLDEREFSGQLHEGEHTKVHIWPVAKRLILVVLFERHFGLVRLRVTKAAEELAKVLQAVWEKSGTEQGTSALGEITDDDIDNLFSDNGSRG